MVNTIQLVIALWAIAASEAQQKSGVYLGEADKDQKYPYVVSFIHGHRRACSGTLIAANWVLTSAECTFLGTDHKVQYGNLSVSPSQANQLSKVVRAVNHPYLHSAGDAMFSSSNLQLVLVETIILKHYGNISALDYKTFTGSAVEFASLEVTHRDFQIDPAKVVEDNVLRPLMLGQGVVTTCDFEGMESPGVPLMCVAPTCESRFQNSWAADSGGPLFYGEKVIGVLQAAGNLPVISFAAVSPFVDWIHLVMTRNSIDDTS